jgi:sulfite exporter TauE/SafE
MTAWDLVAPFGLGLVGSLHCAQMCGPLVLAYSLPMGAARLGCLAGAHVAYNAGRILTYVLLGAAAGTLGGGVGLVGRVAGVANVTALVAGGLLVAAGLALAGVTSKRKWIAVTRPGAGAWLSRLTARWLNSASVPRKFVMGLGLGFLPCGLVYAGLLSALSTGDTVQGALHMAAFGAGTAPMLLGIGFGSQPLGRWTGAAGPRLAATSVIAMGVLLVVRGMMAQAAPHGH